MKISVILSTYNQPLWLTKVLWGYARQDRVPDEVLVADDGSTEETADVVQSAKAGLGLNLRHVWHKDAGFRKTEILNRALEESAGDYLIFSDGDCVPRQDFVATHAANAQQKWFLSGGAIRLSQAASDALCIEDVDTRRCFSPEWIKQHGGASWSQRLKLLSPGLLPAVLDSLTTTKATWNGGNASCWREDALSVGGFDERMQYGGEDREFGERLQNLGIEGMQLRHRAVCLHLEHPRGYVEEGMADKNDFIRQATRATRRVRTEHGLKAA